MLRKTGFWIVVVVIALVGVGGYFVYNTQSAEADSAETTNTVQTSPVRQGDITISATGAGTVIPATQIDVSFQSGGILQELLVRVGDDVQAGDVLARLDDTAVRQAFVSAELQLAQAVMQTDGSATQAGVSYNDIATEQARLNLETAQNNHDDLLNWVADADDIALAESALAAAQAGYNAALGQESAGYNNVQVQAINLEQVQRALVDAQTAYDTAYDPARDWELVDSRTATKFEAERDAADRNLLRAQENLEIAQANYNSSASSSNSSSSKNAQSNVLSAELALQAALDGPTDDEIAAAASTVRQAELAYQQALLNKEADDINLQQAQLNLDTAQQALAQTELTAPAAGIVLSIAGDVGEVVNAGAFVTLADLNRPMVELYLDETDLDKVGLDFDVDVIFDALPDDTFAGTIVQVDPQLYTVSNVTVVRAVVQLDDFNKQQTLPIGMNATVDVIGGRAQNALLVPVEALREISSGQFAVFVMVNGEPEMRFVEVGLKDFTFAEIISGVELGETVTTGIIETQ